MKPTKITCYCEICKKEFQKSKTELKRSLERSGKIICKNCRPVTHNKSKSPEYKSWSSMKSRCNNKNNTHYLRYGGRGIKHDIRWSKFEEFFKDMGEMPQPNMELDRIDNNGNYCKENCRWATRKEQTRNRGGKRATRLYTFNNKTMCIADWAKEIGITPQSLQKRLNKGWPLELALNPEKRDSNYSKRVIKTEPANKGKTIRNKNSKFITIDGVTKTYTEWEKEKGLSKGLISKRLQQGFSDYDAVMKPVNKKP